MTGRTTIEWTAMPGYEPAVWNAVTGCTRVSAGCTNCYAFALHDKRYAANLKVAKSLIAQIPDAEILRQKVGQTTQATVRFVYGDKALPWPRQYDLPFSRVQLLEDRLDAPLRKRKPTCYFVDSMSDLFHEDVPDEFIDRVFAAMALADWHRFLILTKRPERMRRWLTEPVGDRRRSDLISEQMDQPSFGLPARRSFPRWLPAWPVPNIWLGTSVEDQRAADERIPHLLATPAAVRFLSCEPLLGPVDLDRPRCENCGETEVATNERPEAFCAHCGYEMSWGHWLGPDLIDWVIVGGESGPRARPMDLAWARSLRDQCATAGVAYFMKQLGSNPVMHAEDLAVGLGWRHVSAPATATASDDTWPVKLREAHGRDMSEWPEDLRIRTWPR